MGEYAKRKSDGKEVKIGTCENMYYLRHEDKSKVKLCEGSGFGYRFRLPFPDEDSLQPGDYADHNRAYPLEGFEWNARAEDVGHFSLSNGNGVRVYVECFHGEKKPDCGKAKVLAFAREYALYMIREDAGRLWPVVRCEHCGEQWRADWAHVLCHVDKGEFYDRLVAYSVHGDLKQ